MQFDQILVSSYPAMSALSLTGMSLIIFLFINADKNMPQGNLKKQAGYICLILFLACLGMAAAVMPISMGARRVLFTLEFCIFATLPVIVYRIFLEPDEYPQLRNVVPIISAIIFFMLPLLKRNTMPYLFISLFFPLWIFLIILSYLNYGKILNPIKRKAASDRLIVIFTSGAGFALDGFLAGGLQDLPVLTILLPLWGIYVLTDTAVGRQKYNESLPEKAVPFVLLPVFILLAVFLFKWTDIFLTARGKPLAVTYNQKIIAFTISVPVVLLYYFILLSSRKLIKHFSRQFIDPLEAQLMELSGEAGEYLTLENVASLLHEKTRFCSLILHRRRNGRLFYLASACPSLPLEGESSFTIDSKILAAVSSDGFLKVNPVNVQDYAADNHLSQKIITLWAEKGDVLIAACGGYEKESKYVPPAVAIFYHPEIPALKDSLILSLLGVAQSLGKTAARAIEGEKKHFKIFVSKLSESQTIGELCEQLSELLDGESIKTAIIVKDKGEKESYIYPSGKYNKLPEIVNSGTMYLDFGNKKYNINLFPVDSASADVSLVLLTEKESFTFEHDDKPHLNSLTQSLGLIIDGIFMGEAFAAQLEEIRQKANEAEKSLAEQSVMIAEDIHDTITQDIYAARLQIEFVEKKLSSSSPETRKEMENLKNTVTCGLKSARRLIERLRKASLLQEPENIQEFLTQAGRASGIKISLEGLQDISRDSADDLYMIIREAFNNARKYASAKEIIIKYKKIKSSFILTVSDDGTGFDAAKLAESGREYGSSSISPRCKRNNWQFSVTGRPGGGTVLTVKGNLPKSAG